MAEKYDVGVLGVWFGCNYGSIATYYALEKTIESFGKSVLMVHRPWLKPYDQKSMEKRHSLRFAREYYQISESYQVNDMGKLNELCDAFVLGSDQIWNYGITKIFGHSYFLDFADDGKKKIAYATSFGQSKFLAPWDYAKKAVACMQRMDAVSVREKEGVKILREVFGVKGIHVLDPVLMADPSVLGNLADKAARKENSPYIATYILDPDEKKREALLHVSKKLDRKLVNMLDGWYHKFEQNKNALNLPNTVEQLQVEEWLGYFKNSDFVITDSFHGTCMAILFQKPFIAIGNPGRGSSRFESLLGDLGLVGRYVEKAEEILEKAELLQAIDYREINRKLNAERETSRQWLKDALDGKRQKVKVWWPGRVKARMKLVKDCFLQDGVKPAVKRVLKKVLKLGN